MGLRGRSDAKPLRAGPVCLVLTAVVASSCVVYTPDLLNEEAVSLGRPPGASTAPAPAPAVTPGAPVAMATWPQPWEERARLQRSASLGIPAVASSDVGATSEVSFVDADDLEAGDLDAVLEAGSADAGSP